MLLIYYCSMILCYKKLEWQDKIILFFDFLTEKTLLLTLKKARYKNLAFFGSGEPAYPQYTPL